MAYRDRKIVIDHIFPPIPDRRFDYQATFDGYDEGEPIGFGPTAEAAKADLLEQVEDDEPEEDDVWPGKRRVVIDHTGSRL